MNASPQRIAVLIPAYNEEVAIGSTVKGFSGALPGATIYVYDNNSKDKTCEQAERAGAVVRSEPLQGKGNVVRRMFSDIDADVYVMTDGDATYDAAAAPSMIELLVKQNLDMVVGRRIHEQVDAYRPGHVLGNRMLTGSLASLFGQRFTDILSGYRVFSRRYVKSFPALATGFETETELTVHALTLAMPIAEVDTKYFARPEGSASFA
jgi:glycosyltransferase involved in cell wall biosynthesis